ncbi:MAG: response regulator-like protein, partial [Herbinix sp.]|nr:response regulator-like protein [Herbinix sp.]
MTNKKLKKTISIRSSVIIYFTVAMLTTVILIGSIIFSNWISSTIDITQKTAKDINFEITYQINNYLDTSEKINEDNYILIENNIVNMKEDGIRNQFLIGILQNHSEYIDSFAYATESGELYGIRKSIHNSFELYKYDSSTKGKIIYYSYDENSGTQRTKTLDSRYDPRESNWY